jgi:hypothetical protein
MKKIAFVFCILLIASSNTIISAQGFRLGLQGTPIVGWFKSETENYHSRGVRMGIGYGFITEFLMAEQYSFATGLNVNYIGGRLSYPIINAPRPSEQDPYTHNERTYRLQYVELPFTVKMKTREIGYNTYFARFGFGAGVNLRAKANDKYYQKNGNSTLMQENIDIKSTTPLFRASMIMGLGLERSLGGNTSLLGGINFNNGITNVLKGKDYQDVRNLNARANYVEVTLGILF